MMPYRKVSMSKHSKSSSSNHHRSHRDPSQGGWDTTIVKAPDSHKSRKKHKRRRHKKWPKVLAIVLAVVLALAAIGVAAALLYKNSIDSAMSLGDDKGKIESVLTDTPASKPFYALVVGSDLRGASDDQALNDTTSGENGTGFSDVIMLVRVDAAHSKVTLLSVPRDTPIDDGAGGYMKLNWAYHNGGAPQLIATVEGITGVKISHYAEVSGEGLENLVDSLGGIIANVPQSFNYTTFTGERVYLEQGVQHLNGAQALALSNMRMQYADDQDANRQSGARQVVTGIINAVKDRPVIELPGTVSKAASCVRTDMNTDELIEIARMMGGSPTVYSGSAPYKGSLDLYTTPTHSANDAIWLCYVNTAGWLRVVQVVDAGDDPSTVSYDKDVVHYAGQPESTWDRGLVAPDELEALSNEGSNASSGESGEGDQGFEGGEESGWE